MSYFILGDDAFSMRTYLMKPYGTRALSNTTIVANYHIFRGRWMVENALGILANCWRKCFLGTMEMCPNTIQVIVEMTVSHNFMRIHYLSVSNVAAD